MKTRLCIILLAAFIAIPLYSNGQELIPAQCSHSLHGFKDKNSGEMVIPCIYYKVWNFSEHIEGLAKVAKNTTPSGAVLATLKYGFIDKTGKEVVPLKYDEIYRFSEYFKDWAMIRVNSRYGFINKLGNEVIPAKFSNSKFSFSEGLAVVVVNNKYGFIDKSGKEVIPCRYEYAENFNNGLSRVKYGGDDGFIDIAGYFYYGKNRSKAEKKIAAKIENGDYRAIYAQIREAEKRVLEATENEAREIAERARMARELEAKKPTFSYFAKTYVEQKINEWQKKGEFESTAEWQQRVNETSRNEKINIFKKEAEEKYIVDKSRNVNLEMTLGDYDADNHTFLIKSIFGDMIVPVPKNEALDFKNKWNHTTKTPKYFIENDILALAEMSFKLDNGKTYKYSKDASLNYTEVNIAYNFAPIDIDSYGNLNFQKGSQNISTVNLNVGKSDVDIDIPVTGAKNDKTFAVIIANENYRSESKVEFAKNDGETFRKYCIQTLGLPEKNVHYMADATLNDIRREINWLNDIANAYKEEAKIIFYYGGHGIPDEKAKTSYLLPVDGCGSDPRTGYKLDNLYQKLGSLPVRSVIVFMDACFSGAQRSGEMLASARGVAIRAEQGVPTGNVVVFSAAQGNETAHPYREKGHGLFTYFLLKKLQETKGEATLGELENYITIQVKQQSVVVNRKSQTPTVISAAGLANWKDLKLR